jgi:hypothetical protein
MSRHHQSRKDPTGSLPAFFRRVGRWLEGAEGLTFSPDAGSGLDVSWGDTLYAFCVRDGTVGSEQMAEVVHLAMTSQPLASRMDQYLQGDLAEGQFLGRIRRLIVAELEAGRVVEVHGFGQEQASLHWEGCEVNLAAGLYRSLQQSLAPGWDDGWEEDDDEEGDGERPGEDPSGYGQPGVEEFRNAIREKIRTAAEAGLEYVEIRSGDLHDALEAEARHAACCQAMRSLHGPGDLILGLPRDREVNHHGVTFDQQRNGNRHSGANLVVRYRTAGR